MSDAIDCLSCRELVRDMHPTVAATIPAIDLCSHCLEQDARNALADLAETRADLRRYLDAGRDVLPADLVEAIWTAIVGGEA